jgi:hypothetical protein
MRDKIMKRVLKYTNIYVVTGFILFFTILYLVSLVFINKGISGSSSVEIYNKQKALEEQGKH